MKEGFEGQEILDLLNNLRPGPLIGEVQRLFEDGFEKRKVPEEASKYCKGALDILNDNEERTLYDSKQLADTRGRLHLLLASVYLAEERQLEKAQKHYIESRDIYHSMQLDRFESLAYLGLAVTLRKMGILKNASDVLKQASDKCENAYTIANNIDDTDSPQAIENLLEVIEQERIRIHQLISPGEKPIPELYPSSRRRRTVSEDEDKPEKTFRVCDIVVGRKIIEEERDATKLNIFGLEQYEKYFKYESLPVINLPEEAKSADYILLIEGVDDTKGAVVDVTKGPANETATPLDKQHLLFIKSKRLMSKEDLDHKLVAVLVMTRRVLTIQTYATLKLLVKCEDHCLLRRVYFEDPSIVVASYGTDSKLEKYYGEYRPFVKKFAYDVAISGEVVKVMHRREVFRL